MLETLKKITSGKGQERDLEILEELAEGVARGSLCGLGQTAPNPVKTTLRYFRNEYEAHINEKRCVAKKCKALITYEIIPENCKGCGLCARNCPSEAITGEKKQAYIINPEKCVRCGLCLGACRFSAISVR